MTRFELGVLAVVNAHHLRTTRPGCRPGPPSPSWPTLVGAAVVPRVDRLSPPLPNLVKPAASERGATLVGCVRGNNVGMLRKLNFSLLERYENTIFQKVAFSLL